MKTHTSSQRPLRVGEMLRRTLSDLLRRSHFHDPELHDLNITVTEVQVTPDLRFATAFILSLGGKNMETILPALQRVTPFLRNRIGQIVKLRYIPQLRFKNDSTFDKAHRINEILKQIRYKNQT